MGTTWEELELRATTFIKNDLSLDWDKANRLPVFFNRMRAYMVEAIPKFNRPPEMLQKLAAYTAPAFESVSYTTIAGEDQTVETEVLGATVVSAGIIAEDDFGDVQYTPLHRGRAYVFSLIFLIASNIALGIFSQPLINALMLGLTQFG